MGQISGHVCGKCGKRFSVRDGGGFFFDMLHCDRCGRAQSVAHQDLGDIHLRFAKGLRTPYALARAAMDRDIQANYPGEPIGRDEYHRLAEDTLDACACGGTYRYDAPARCPDCGATSESWEEDPEAAHVFVD